VTEATGADGQSKFVVDFDKLRQELSGDLLEEKVLDDSTATNFEQIFKTYSPSTTTKIL